MTAGLRGDVDQARTGRAAGPPGVAAIWSVSGSDGGLEGDFVAERFELLDEPAGSVFGRVAAGEPVGAELAGGDAGGLGQRAAQPAVAAAGLAGAASAARLVGAGADRGPGDEVAGGREDAHVEAALGDQHLGGGAADAGDRAEQVDELSLGRERELDAGI